MKNLSDSLLTRLLTADICCRDCGQSYGSYSVGCSSTWQAECQICGETKGCTEVRDWGYLTKGIKAEKEKIAGQSKDVAAYMAPVGPIMDDNELEDALTASYEVGEITLKLTEDEVAYLNHCLDVISDAGVEDEDQEMFVSIEKKITELYGDNCVTFELSPALKKFHELYGTFGTEDEVEQAKWEVFRDAFHAGFDQGKEEGVQ